MDANKNIFSAPNKIEPEDTGPIEQETTPNENEAFAGEIQDVQIAVEVCK